ncbi:MAG: type II secretion system protein [Cyanobacteriota bacterium]|nr:type II secretion system protein [Cyanobacteriota bacterium]
MTGTRAEQGFGLVEAMVSMVILTLASLTALQLFGGFSRSLTASRQRDAISNLVAADLAQLRSAVQSWCRVLPNASGVPASACSGTIATSDWRGSYNPPAAACDASTLAEALVAASPSAFPASATLAAAAADPAPLQGVVLTRTLQAAGNTIEVTYASTAGTSVAVHTRATLVPAALGWCP